MLLSKIDNLNKGGAKTGTPVPPNYIPGSSPNYIPGSGITTKITFR